MREPSKRETANGRTLLDGDQSLKHNVSNPIILLCLREDCWSEEWMLDTVYGLFEGILGYVYIGLNRANLGYFEPIWHIWVYTPKGCKKHS